MTVHEKNAWVYLVLAITISTIYVVVVFGQLPTTPVDQIDYLPALATAIIAAIVVGIVVGMVLGATSRDRARTDERDALITRRGELVGYYVLSAGVIGALALVLTEQPYFWIAQAIYGAFVISAIASSVVKLVAYRRGF